MKALVRGLLALLLILTVSGVVLAGGQKEAAKPTVRFSNFWTDATYTGKKFSEGFKEFAEKNKDLANYTMEIAQFDAQRDKIKIDLAANNLPDVFIYWDFTLYSPMVDSGLLLEVHEYLNRTSALKWSDIPQGAWDSNTPDGKNYYGIPMKGFVDFFMANRDLFRKYNLKYPTTYDELIQVGKVFQQNGIIPLAIGSKGGNASHFFHAELLQQYVDMDWMKGITTGKSRFDSPEMLKVSQLCLDMAKAGLFPKDTIASGEFAPPASLMNEEKAAMILAQTWMINMFKEDIAKKFDYIPIPKMPGYKIDPATFRIAVANNSWLINKQAFMDAKKQKAIIALLDWLNSDEAVGWIAEGGDWIVKKVTLDPSKLLPFYVTVMDWEAKANKKAAQMVYSMLPDPIVQEAYSAALDELWARAISAEDFVKKIQAVLDKQLKK
jgi:raffinose/stachyose/melibiose transport system substrate-binding protein